MLDLPPSTPIIWPVIQELLLVSKKLAKLAESNPSPILFNGCILAIELSIAEFLITELDIFDFVKLGAIQFIRILGASSAAKATVKPSIAALADEIILWFVNPFFAATVENRTIDPLFLVKLFWKALIISVAETRLRT